MSFLDAFIVAALIVVCVALSALIAHTLIS